MTHDFFAYKAASFDANSKRVDNIQQIADTMLTHLPFRADMKIMDFGSGTGLLLERLAAHVAHVTAVDVSPAMNRELEAKRQRLACSLELLPMDLTRERPAGSYDAIVSSMTLHHVADVGALLQTFLTLLQPGGFIALADLDEEDGSFHSEDTGIFHHGFARAPLQELASEMGYRHVTMRDASIISKPQRDYPVFLLSGFRG